MGKGSPPHCEVRLPLTPCAGHCKDWAGEGGPGDHLAFAEGISFKTQGCPLTLPKHADSLPGPQPPQGHVGGWVRGDCETIPTTLARFRVPCPVYCSLCPRLETTDGRGTKHTTLLLIPGGCASDAAGAILGMLGRP